MVNGFIFKFGGWYPTYFGTVEGESDTKLIIESHDDFGLLSTIPTIYDYMTNKGYDNSWYGKRESYHFPVDGVKEFHFSSNSTQGNIDVANRILASSIDLIGGTFSNSLKGDLVTIGANDVTVILRTINSIGLESIRSSFPYFDFAVEVSNDMIDVIWSIYKTGVKQAIDNELKLFDELGERHPNYKSYCTQRVESLKKVQKYLGRALRAYSIMKGVVNIINRFVSAHKAPNPIDFRLLCYNDEVYNWSNIKQYKGDGQTGIEGVELDEPISVMVNADVIPMSEYIVKFEVTKGGGSVGNSEKTEEYVEIRDNVASINWTLGYDSEEQIVRASLCKKSSKEVVCEPVEFKATGEQEFLPIYIENIEYEESPYFSMGKVVFKPTITVSTNETEKLENLYDWGLVIYYKDDNSGIHQVIERIKMGKNYNSIDFTRIFTLEKSDMDIDCVNFIAKNDDKFLIGTYVKYEINGRTFDSDVLIPIELVYNRKPEIIITNFALEERSSGRDENDDIYYQDVFNIYYYLNGALFLQDHKFSIYKISYHSGQRLYNVSYHNHMSDESKYNSFQIGNIYWECSKMGGEYYLEVILGNGQTIQSTNRLIERSSFPCSYYIK